MFDWLMESGREVAKQVVGRLMVASLAVKYGVLKTSEGVQLEVNYAMFKGQMAVLHAMLEMGMQGQAGRTALEKVRELSEFSAYKNGVESIRWLGG
jgi:hypothetical protein